jgi:hypothetical protein
MTEAKDRLRAAREFGVPAKPSFDNSTEDLPSNDYSRFEEVQRRLRAVFGAAGFELLYRRSLIGAAAHHPVLSAADPSGKAEQLVNTLQAANEHPAEEVAAALRAIMAEQRSLLKRLIGEELLDAVLLSSTEPPPFSEADTEPHPDD